MFRRMLLKDKIVSGQHKRKNVWLGGGEARGRRDGRKECIVSDPWLKPKKTREEHSVEKRNPGR